MSEKRALIIGIAGQDGSFLAELLLDEGYEVFGVVRQPASTRFENLVAIRDDIELMQADVLDELSLVDVARVVSSAGGLQPRLAVVRADVVAVSRCSPPSSPPSGCTALLEAIRRVDDGHPLLPGVVERDLRRAARGAPDRGDAALPGHAVRRREGLRALHHAELPPAVRAPRLVGDPLQPRVAAAPARLRHAQGRARGGSDQPRPRERGRARRPRRAPRLGLRGRLRARDVAHAAAGRSRATT